MDIAALSMNLSTMKAANAIQISLLKKTMDVSEDNADRMIQMMQQTAAVERSVHPHIGAQMDLRG